MCLFRFVLSFFFLNFISSLHFHYHLRSVYVSARSFQIWLCQLCGSGAKNLSVIEKNEFKTVRRIIELDRATAKHHSYFHTNEKKKNITKTYADKKRDEEMEERKKSTESSSQWQQVCFVCVNHFNIYFSSDIEFSVIYLIKEKTKLPSKREINRLRRNEWWRW